LVSTALRVRSARLAFDLRRVVFRFDVDFFALLLRPRADDFFVDVFRAAFLRAALLGFLFQYFGFYRLFLLGYVDPIQPIT
jgi:hypothetical protein